MVFDWANEKDFCMTYGSVHKDSLKLSVPSLTFEKIGDGKGIGVRPIVSSGNVPVDPFVLNKKYSSFENCTFRNFPRLVIDGLTMKDCTFEDCGTITTENESAFINCRFERVAELDCRFDSASFYNCHLENCGNIWTCDGSVDNTAFSRIAFLLSERTQISGCRFSELYSDAEDDGDGLIDLCDTEISGCTFENIELTNDAWLITASGDCIVSDSKFINCITDREDGELAYGKCQQGSIIKKWKYYDVIDVESCEVIE